MKIKEALRSISSRLSNPVFLKGDDYFLQEFFIKKVSKQFFGNNKYSRTLMLPDDMKGKEIIERLITTDLLKQISFFIIRNAQRIVGKPSNDLLEICKNPNSNHLLFLIIDDWFSKKLPLYQKIESFIEPVDTQTPFDKDMKKWAKYLINEQNKSADYRVISYLIDIAGDSLVHLNNEINKICISIGKRKNIEVEDLEQFLGWRRERQLWEFLMALGSKNFEKSIEIGKSLIDKNILLLSLVIPLLTYSKKCFFQK